MLITWLFCYTEKGKTNINRSGEGLMGGENGLGRKSTALGLSWYLPHGEEGAGSLTAAGKQHT